MRTREPSHRAGTRRRTSTPARLVWTHLVSITAGLLAGAVVTVSMLLGVHAGVLAASPTVDKVTVVLASLTAVLVMAAVLRRRGVGS